MQMSSGLTAACYRYGLRSARRRRRIVVVAVLFALLPASAAWACSLAAPRLHAIDAAEARVDTQAPDPITDAKVVVMRGHGPSCNAGICTESSCSGSGEIHLELGSLHDDRSAPDRIGVSLEWMAGAIPDGLLPEQAVVPEPDGSLDLVWDDDASDAQEPLDFTLLLRSVDAAGNQSAPYAVRIQDPGTASGLLQARAQRGQVDGCSAAGPPGQRGRPLPTLALFALVGLVGMILGLVRRRLSG
jgi:hypothetical protein